MNFGSANALLILPRDIILAYDNPRTQPSCLLIALYENHEAKFSLATRSE